jgi:cell wall-associated NlpC family hydrolase
MAGNGINGPALGAIAVGGILVWSGIKGASVTASLRDLVTGVAPSGQDVNPISTPVTATPSATSTPITATSSSIANDALQYEGHCYAYGGAPGPSGTSCWDCSSFVNWVLGHDLGMTLPGNASPGYSGTSHGPNTLSYLAWSGAETVGHSASIAQAGDLIVGITHMGIATGGGNYISAHDVAERTSVKPISTFPDPLFYVRRIIIGTSDG